MQSFVHDDDMGWRCIRRERRTRRPIRIREALNFVEGLIFMGGSGHST
jgi:hypothetical protein